MQCAQLAGARFAIDLGTVELEVDRETARLDALDVVDALDDIGLPERLVAIQDQRMQARDLNAEVTPVTWLGQRYVANMVFEIDLRFVDPVGTVEIERHAHQTAAQHRRHIKALANVGHDVAQSDLAAGRGARIIDPQHCLMHALVRTLQCEEQFVETAKLFHG